MMTCQTRRPCFQVAALLVLLTMASSPAWADYKQVQVYDAFKKPGGYTISDYAAKWSNPYGLGEMAGPGGDTRSFPGGKFSISAVPFQTGYDFSVYDHIKYLAVSNQTFAVPARGSLTFSSVIEAKTPGTHAGRVIHGTYTATGKPYAKSTLQGQQAGAVMNMIDFGTGQLFDWFIAGDTAFALIERLPSAISGSPLPAGRDKIYTQIIKEVKIRPGPHLVSITYTRKSNTSTVQFFLDGQRIAKVRDVGVPLDAQRVKFTGTYPALGRGEKLVNRINSFAIGHGLFSLLDAFPFQLPEAPELSVSIPLSERLFGQGASAKFDDFTVITQFKEVDDNDDEDDNDDDCKD